MKDFSAGESPEGKGWAVFRQTVSASPERSGFLVTLGTARAGRVAPSLQTWVRCAGKNSTELWNPPFPDTLGAPTAQRLRLGDRRQVTCSPPQTTSPPTAAAGRGAEPATRGKEGHWASGRPSDLSGSSTSPPAEGGAARGRCPRSRQWRPDPGDRSLSSFPAEHCVLGVLPAELLNTGREHPPESPADR